MTTVRAVLPLQAGFPTSEVHMFRANNLIGTYHPISKAQCVWSYIMPNNATYNSSNNSTSEPCLPIHVNTSSNSSEITPAAKVPNGADSSGSSTTDSTEQQHEPHDPVKQAGATTYECAQQVMRAVC